MGSLCASAEARMIVGFEGIQIRAPAAILVEFIMTRVYLQVPRHSGYAYAFEEVLPGRV